jgi:hypothetical protein
MMFVVALSHFQAVLSDFAEKSIITADGTQFYIGLFFLKIINFHIC